MMVLRFLLYGLLPTLLLFLTSDVAPWDKFQAWHLVPVDADLKTWKLVCFMLGAVMTTLIVPMENHRLRKRNEHLKKSSSGLLKLIKNTRVKELCSSLGTTYPFSTRYLVPSRTPWARACAQMGMNVNLKLKELPGITDEFEPADLSFVTHPQPEGCVGHTYKTGNGIIADNLDPNSPYTQSLTPKNLTLLNRVKFCATMPINRSGRKGKRAGVLAFDCEQLVALTDQKQKDAFTTFMKDYAGFVDTYKNL